MCTGGYRLHTGQIMHSLSYSIMYQWIQGICILRLPYLVIFTISRSSNVGKCHKKITPEICWALLTHPLCLPAIASTNLTLKSNHTLVNHRNKKIRMH